MSLIADTQLIARIDAALPQTQCTRCGYPACHAYAEAVASDMAGINQCPPGGADGVARLAALTGRPALPLKAAYGLEGPRWLAVIDEAWCIGCTLCIKACPVDCIVGAPKQMHVVVAEQCTGCELCLPACPVDCISLVNVTGTQTGWAAWSAPQADAARKRYQFHQLRETHVTRESQDAAARPQAKAQAQAQAQAQAKLAHLGDTSSITDPVDPGHKRASIEAALARARAKRQG